ncbi:MAG TPA: DUF3460 family protein [Rhodocyclaceae bacterium]
MAKYDPTYVSEFAKFMKEYLDNHPEVVADQYVGRGIWWDKPADFEMMEEAARDSVPVDGYYYFGNPGTTR